MYKFIKRENVIDIYIIIKSIRTIFIFLLLLFLIYFVAMPIAKFICFILTLLLSVFFNSTIPMSFQLFKMTNGLYHIYIYNCKFIGYFYTFLLSIICTNIINYFISIGAKNNDQT